MSERCNDIKLQWSPLYGSNRPNEQCNQLVCPVGEFVSKFDGLVSDNLSRVKSIRGYCGKPYGKDNHSISGYITKKQESSKTNGHDPTTATSRDGKGILYDGIKYNTKDDGSIIGQFGARYPYTVDSCLFGNCSGITWTGSTMMTKDDSDVVSKKCPDGYGMSAIKTQSRDSDGNIYSIRFACEPVTDDDIFNCCMGIGESCGRYTPDSSICNTKILEYCKKNPGNPNCVKWCNKDENTIKCTNIYTDYCKLSENEDAPECSCYKGSIYVGEGYIPECMGTKCIMDGYKPNGKCTADITQVNCNVINQMNDAGDIEITNDILQRCGAGPGPTPEPAANYTMILIFIVVIVCISIAVYYMANKKGKSSS